MEPIRAVEMVRTIRDALYEKTKDLSPAELIEFYARESKQAHAEAERDRQEPPESRLA